jgi:hypothetical protein
VKLLTDLISTQQRDSLGEKSTSPISPAINKYATNKQTRLSSDEIELSVVAGLQQFLHPSVFTLLLHVLLVLTCLLSLSGAVAHKAKRLLSFTIAKKIVYLLPKILHKCTPYSIPSIAESTFAEYSQKCAAGAFVFSLSLSLSLPLSIDLSIYLSICAHGCKCCEDVCMIKSSIHKLILCLNHRIWLNVCMIKSPLHKLILRLNYRLRIWLNVCTIKSPYINCVFEDA